MFVVSLTNLMNLEERESRTFGLLGRLQMKDELRLAAANLLNSAYRERNEKKKKDTKNLKKAQRTFRQNLMSFEAVAR